MKNKKILILILSVIAVLVILVIGICFIPNDNNEKNNFSIGKGEQVKITKSEAKSVEFEEYNNGLISLQIPKGWKVDTLGDYIHYTFKAYNPENPSYQFFLNLKTEGYNKSEDAKKFQQKYYPDSMFAKTSVISDKTTEGFYKIFNDLGTLNDTATFTFPKLTNFTVKENMGTSPAGGDILRASFKDSNGKDGEGIFMAYVYDAGSYYVNENIMSGKQIDIYYLNVYNTMFMTTPKDELVNWEDTLNKIAGSLQFSETFLAQYNSQQDAVMKTFQSVRSVCNQMSDMIMSSWEKRNTTYDIMSQKQSDATLGYERVYDTETGETYKAYNGFTDDYTGERYKAISDDMYTKPIDGYIEK